MSCPANISTAARSVTARPGNKGADSSLRGRANAISASRPRHVCLLLGCLLLVVWLVGCERPEPSPLPPGFSGEPLERHYAIYLEDTLSGRIRERRGMTDAGAPRMDTRVEMMLPGTGLLYREERLSFKPEPPHYLHQRTRFTRTPAGIEHHEVHDGKALGSPMLAHLAGMQAMLEAEPGTRVSQPGLFGTGESSPDTEWTVQARDDGGHTLAEGTRSDGARVQLELDAAGMPVRYQIGRSFRVQRTESAPELPAGEQPLLLVPADRSPGDRNRIRAMQLQLLGLTDTDLMSPGPGLELGSSDNDSLILKTSQPGRSVLNEDQRKLLQALVDQVRGQLRYHAGAAPPGLEALVADGRGDCYEYASLFNALARSEGLQSRVVTGLAWAGDALQGFAPHAWNEVRVDDHWVSVDPTWNQVGADASRIRFPDDPAAQLDLQMALREAHVRIVEIERD